MRALLLSAVVAIAATGCRSSVPAAKAPAGIEASPVVAAPRCLDGAKKRALDGVLARNQAKSPGARARAGGFLDALGGAPFDLRAHKIKGKKKLVEALAASPRLFKIPPADARPALLARVTALTAVTREDR